MLFVVLGGRRDAIARLRLSDIVRDRVGPAPDHRRGLVLMIVPEKALARGEMRAKPIPAEIAMVLDTYVACLDRVRRGRALPASAPLFVRSWQDDRPSATKAWATWSLAGRRRRPCGRPSTAAGGGKNSGPALVPRDDAPSEAYIDKYEQRVVPAAGVAPPDRAQITQILCALRGFTAHEFRHFAFQLASRAASCGTRSIRGPAQPCSRRRRRTHMPCSTTPTSATTGWLPSTAT